MSFGTDWVEKKRALSSSSDANKKEMMAAVDAMKTDSRWGSASIRPIKTGQMMMPSYGSGRGDKNNPKFIDYDLDEEVDCTNILKAIAKSHPVVVTGVPVIKYIPMYRHPLPVSKHRHEHTSVLTRVLSCPLHKQAAAAVTFSDPWTLEEVYMRGAPVDRKEANGYTPLHIACEGIFPSEYITHTYRVFLFLSIFLIFNHLLSSSSPSSSSFSPPPFSTSSLLPLAIAIAIAIAILGNKIECVMVLLNIGVDINATSLAGITPLYLAKARYKIFPTGSYIQTTTSVLVIGRYISP